MSKPKVLVGLTGGIAAYKTLDVIRSLAKQGVEVRCILTRNAAEFVTPLSVETLSGFPASVEMFGSRGDASIEHIELALWPDLVLVAPATANFLGKLANGIADNLLSTTFLALNPTIPIVVAPAMNSRMWLHAAVQRNLCTIADDLGGRFVQVGPVDKLLACGEEGIGAMAEPEDIVTTVLKHLSCG